MNDGEFNASSLKGAGVIAGVVLCYLVAATMFGSGTFSNAPAQQSGDGASASLVAPISDPQMTKAVQLAQRSGSSTGWSTRKSSGPQFKFDTPGGPIVLSLEEVNAANATYRQLKQIESVRKGRKFTSSSSSASSYYDDEAGGWGSSAR